MLYLAYFTCIGQIVHIVGVFDSIEEALEASNEQSVGFLACQFKIEPIQLNVRRYR